MLFFVSSKKKYDFKLIQITFFIISFFYLIKQKRSRPFTCSFLLFPISTSLIKRKLRGYNLSFSQIKENPILSRDTKPSQTKQTQWTNKAQEKSLPRFPNSHFFKFQFHSLFLSLSQKSESQRESKNQTSIVNQWAPQAATWRLGSRSYKAKTSSTTCKPTP